MGLLVNADGCLSLEELLNAQNQTSSRRSQLTKSRAQCAAKGTKASNVVEAYTMEDQKLESTEDDSIKLPSDYEAERKVDVVSAGDQFIKGFGFTLKIWVEATASDPTDKTQKPPHFRTGFHGVRAPELRIQEYLNRIRKYFIASDECYVLALVYIDRVGQKDPAMAVCDLNVHRLLVIAAMLAAKFHDDVYYSNNYYAKVGGLNLKELNALEARFLKMLDWKLFVDTEEYEHYHNIVCSAFVEPEPEP